MSRVCLDLEIGDSIATLTHLMGRGSPEPDEFPFRPYSSVRIAGDGRSKGFGFPSVTWRWNFLSQQMVNIFLGFFATDIDASTDLVIVTYTDTGAGLAAMRERFNAIMHRPIEGEGKSTINESKLPMYSDVSINFTRLEIT